MRSAVALALLLAASLRSSAASPIPLGYEQFDVHDLTLTLRDDNYRAIAVDPVDPRVVYVGTEEGRVFRSADRGATWKEATVIPELKPLWAFPAQPTFFGAIRGASELDATAHQVDLGVRVARFSGLMGRRAVHPNLSEPPPAQFTDPFVALSQASASSTPVMLGVGISERAPRLSLLVRSKGRPVPVWSMKKLLYDRGVHSTIIRGLVIHPKRRELLFAATEFGLYKSFDSGQNWVRTWSGALADERKVFAIAFDPIDASRVLLGTNRGLYRSDDGGENWQKAATVPDGDVLSITFDPYDQRYIYVGTGGGLFRSRDRGQSYQPAYYSTQPARAKIFSLAVRPGDTGHLGTEDGVLVSHRLREGGSDDWQLAGGLRTGELKVLNIAVCPRHPSHLYILTRTELPTLSLLADGPQAGLFESWDDGQTFRPLFQGMGEGTGHWFVLDPREPDDVWLTWSSGVFHIERVRDRHAVGAGLDIPARATSDPPVEEVLEAALRYHGLDLESYGKKLAHARHRAWMPALLRLQATGGLIGASGRQLEPFVIPDSDRYVAEYRLGMWRIMLYASWNLPRLVYTPEAVPMLQSRILQMNQDLYRRITRTVVRNYGELLRLRAHLAAAPPDDLYTRAVYRIRAEQLEAVVDLASGGYLTRRKGGMQ